MFGKFNRVRTVKPLARTEGLSVTESGDETLVYDREQFVIHRLDAKTSRIWRLSDGSRDLQQIHREVDESVQAVRSAVDSLTSLGLVQVNGGGKF